MFRKTIYRDTIKDLEPLSGAIEIYETLLGGRRAGE